MFTSAAKVDSQLQCQEQCINHIPYYLSGLLRTHFFFSTTFLEIAVFVVSSVYVSLTSLLFLSGRIILRDHFPSKVDMSATLIG